MAGRRSASDLLFESLFLVVVPVELLSRPVDQDHIGGFRLGLCFLAGPFDEFPLTKVAPARMWVTRWGALTVRTQERPRRA